MYTLFLVLLIIVSLLLVGAVLLQSGKGSGLAANFGGSASSSDAFMGTRQISTWLTKGTWWLGGVFLFLSFGLAIMSARPAVPSSILDQPPLSQQQPASPVQQAPAGANPLVPLQAAPPAPAPPSAPAKAPPR
jgi:preprotein translocase subunit SecG